MHGITNTLWYLEHAADFLTMNYIINSLIVLICVGV